MVRRIGVLLLAILILSGIVLTSQGRPATAQSYYYYDINTQLTPGDYRLYTMVLQEDQELTGSLSAIGGNVDIYLLDASGTSAFLAVVTGASPTGTWPYYDDFSQLDTDSFLSTYAVTNAGTYSVAVLNNETFAVTISGSIESGQHEAPATFDWSLLAVIVGAGAVAVLVVVLLVLIPRTYRLQAEMDSITRESQADGIDVQRLRKGFGGKCPFCGYKNPQGSMFCASCGEKIE